MLSDPPIIPPADRTAELIAARPERREPLGGSVALARAREIVSASKFLALPMLSLLPYARLMVERVNHR